MTTASLPTDVTHGWTAAELRKADAATRDAVLQAAAIEAVATYHTDTDLTDFEAFGKDDLHGDSSNSVTEPG